MSFLPSREAPAPSFWKDLLLVALPAAIASIGPVVVHHWLTKPDQSEASPVVTEEPAPKKKKRAPK